MVKGLRYNYWSIYNEYIFTAVKRCQQPNKPSTFWHDWWISSCLAGWLSRIFISTVGPPLSWGFPVDLLPFISFQCSVSSLLLYHYHSLLCLPTSTCILIFSSIRVFVYATYKVYGHTSSSRVTWTIRIGVLLWSNCLKPARIDLWNIYSNYTAASTFVYTYTG